MYQNKTVPYLAILSKYLVKFETFGIFLAVAAAHSTSKTIVTTDDVGTQDPVPIKQRMALP